MPKRVARISITVEADLLREVKGMARRAGQSISALVSAALARAVRRQRLEKIVSAHEARRGPITEDELRATRQRWRG